MSPEPAPTFGTLLQGSRLAAGLTQEEIAEWARLSTRAISDLERGVSRIPRQATLDLLVEAFSLIQTQESDCLPGYWVWWGATRATSRRQMR
jgi:transcriptional regulator with XRE-family HTH domain